MGAIVMAFGLQCIGRSLFTCTLKSNKVQCHSLVAWTVSVRIVIFSGDYISWYWLPHSNKWFINSNEIRG